DMAFDQFTGALEIYRRYLLHPRLVPIFAFSKTLALELLTLHLGSHFGYRERRIGEGEPIRRTVQTLAAHFLDKLLPPQNRVVLDLPERVLLDLSIRSGTYDPPYPVRDLLRRTCELLFGNADLWDHILPGSLRRQLQLLDALQQQFPGPGEESPAS